MILLSEKLEELVGLKYEDWTLTTLVDIVQTEETFNLFTTEMATYMFENKTNDILYDIMLPVKYGHYIKEVKILIDTYLHDLEAGTMTREEFAANIETLRNGKLFSKILAYFTIVYVLDEVSILENLEDIHTCVDELLDIINEVKLETGMNLIADIMDLIEPIRTIFHERYEIDIFDGLDLKEKYKGIIDMLNKASEEMILDRIAQENEDTGE